MTRPAAYSRAAASSRCARYGDGFPSHSPAPKTTATGARPTSASARTPPSLATRIHAEGSSASTHSPTTAHNARRCPRRVRGHPG
ncbi:hypothetical protein, partial [Streptomyces sp. SA3_actF]